MEQPEYCAGCGKFTRSHNVAIDVSEHDKVGLPTMVGVVCHTCWTGDTGGVREIRNLYADAAPDDPQGAVARTRLLKALDFDSMVASAVPVEELVGGDL